MLFRQVGTIRFQYLETVDEVHSSIPCSTESQFIFLKQNTLI